MWKIDVSDKDYCDTPLTMAEVTDSIAQTLLIITWLNLKDINTNSFCEDHPETVMHLFWYCSHTRTFWQNLSRFIIDYLNIYKDFALFHIHKCKFSTKKTNFVLFLHEVGYYINLISGSNNKKTKTYGPPSRYNDLASPGKTLLYFVYIVCLHIVTYILKSHLFFCNNT